MKHQLSSPI
uniref:Uncharacterized protein n=1 Tax=Arundo donax TaxID=35708 RepID=A0A0A8Y1L4_ARUDO